MTNQLWMEGQTSSCRSPTKQFVLSSMSVGHVLNNLQQPTVPTSVPYSMTLTTRHVAAPGTDHSVVLYRTITPYNPDGWKLALLSSGLTHSFPNLVHDMTYGVPIGNLPPLTHTFIIWNLLKLTHHTWMTAFRRSLLLAALMAHFQSKKCMRSLVVISAQLSWDHWKAQINFIEAHLPSFKRGQVFSVYKWVARSLSRCHKVLHGCWCCWLCE